MKNKLLLALALLLIVVLWMASGKVETTPEQQAEVMATKANTQLLMKVKVVEVKAQQIDREIVIQGELQPLRQIELQAQTASTIIDCVVEQGSKVNSGEVMLKLEAEDRFEQLQRARAHVKSMEVEWQGVNKLQQKGLRSDTHLKAAEAALADAKAQLKRAAMELDYLQIKAPFSGVLEQRYVELGSRVQTGDPLLTLVDHSIVKAVGSVSQQSASQLQVGQTVKVKLLDGRQAQGKLSYIASVGDSGTHSFKVESKIANQNGYLNPGVSAELRIIVGQDSAHFLSPSILSLNLDGEVGIKVLDEDNRVSFYAVELVKTEEQGVWISGLPVVAKVITLGQGFVNQGEQVVPVMDVN